MLIHTLHWSITLPADKRTATKCLNAIEASVCIWMEYYDKYFHTSRQPPCLTPMHAGECPTSEENDVGNLALIWDPCSAAGQITSSTDVAELQWPDLARHGGEPLLDLVVSEQRVEAAEAALHGEVGGAALVLGDLCTHHKQWYQMSDTAYFSIEVLKAIKRERYSRISQKPILV